VKVRVLTLDELDRASWDELIDSTSKAGVFHTWRWASVLEESFDSMSAVFFVVEESGTYSCGFPAIVESKPPATYFLSMPFGSYGGLVEGKAERAELEMIVAEVGKYCKGERMWHAEISDFYGTCEPDWFGGFDKTRMQAHVLDLSGGFDVVWTERFNKNIRKMVRQARKKGVTVSKFSKDADLEAYISLAEHTLKRRGNVTKEVALYSNCIRLMAASGNATGHLAWWEGRPVAGAIHLVGKDEAMNWLSASDSSYWHVRPNNLVVCRVIEEMCKRGLKRYNFGSSPESAKELIRYKESWGAKKHPYVHLVRSSRRYRGLRRMRRILPF
jgi:CelD/BcsL family acetyltransferase involved in cellulose biosynthesis